MNATTIAHVLRFVSERQPQLQSGSAFLPESAACRHAERLAHLVPLLHWLSPLNPITLEDQQTLGLVGANGRALHACDEEADLPLEESEDELV